MMCESHFLVIKYFESSIEVCVCVCVFLPIKEMIQAAKSGNKSKSMLRFYQVLGLV